MKIVNGVIYGIIGILFVTCFVTGRKKEEKWLVFVRRHGYLLLLLLVVNTVSFAMTFIRQKAGTYIEKGGYGEEAQQIPFVLEQQETEQEITLEVRARQLTDEQREEKMEEAFAYLEDHIRGENESLARITQALDFSIDYEAYPFDVDFVPEDYALMDGDGNLKNEEKELLAQGYTQKELKEGIPAKLTVTLWYEEESREKTYDLTVYPKEKNKIEQLFGEVEETLQNGEKEAAYDEGFFVPTDIKGVQVTRTDESRITSYHVLLAGFLLAGLLLLREQENRKRKELLRVEQLRRSYPWFVNELVLLLGAGMQVRNILRALIQEFQEGGIQGDDRKPLIEELQSAVHSMELGMAEEQAYYQLGRRLKLPCYIKLMTLLEQNVKRGAKGMTELFEQEELAALEERKNLAKRYGEEAGTKLLGPMAVLLLVVMLMIMLPAFMGFM